MKTVAQLNADILKITLSIQQKFPELSKYLAEMPVTIPDEKHPLINLAALKDYYNTLETLLNNYTAGHNSSTNNQQI